MTTINEVQDEINKALEAQLQASDALDRAVDYAAEYEGNLNDVIDEVGSNIDEMERLYNEIALRATRAGAGARVMLKSWDNRSKAGPEGLEAYYTGIADACYFILTGQPPEGVYAVDPPL